MATWAVGDLQGCLDPLRRLLDAAHFDPAADRLWLVGDLINRGPESLEALRFVRGLGDAAITVLGNHDLHLLAVAFGGHGLRKKDTLAAILEAPDRALLLDWLRTRPLLHFDADHDAVLVHAGIPFLFSLDLARTLAAEVEAAIRAPDPAPFFERMYGNAPDRYTPELAGMDRLRVAVNYLTRMRFIDAQGRLDFDAKEGLDDAPPGFFPWFERLHPDFADRRIVFGHWAALQGRGTPANVLALDTGCVWGNCMTLVCLEDGRRLEVDCSDG